MQHLALLTDLTFKQYTRNLKVTSAALDERLGLISPTENDIPKRPLATTVTLTTRRHQPHIQSGNRPFLHCRISPTRAPRIPCVHRVTAQSARCLNAGC